MAGRGKGGLKGRGQASAPDDTHYTPDTTMSSPILSACHASDMTARTFPPPFQIAELRNFAPSTRNLFLLPSPLIDSILAKKILIIGDINFIDILG